MNVAQNAPASQVLFVDDDELWLVTLERATRGKVQVFAARNGDEARAIARHRPIDVALIDRNMPGESGLEVTRRIRRMCPCVGISLVTSEEITPELALDARDHGADSCNEKPASLATLVIVLQDLARRRAERAEHLPTLAEHEWALVEAALHACAGNKSRAARVLGMTYRGLLNKLKKGPPQLRGD